MDRNAALGVTARERAAQGSQRNRSESRRRTTQGGALKGEVLLRDAPYSSVVGGNLQPALLQRNYVVQRPPLQLFAIVAGNRKPERHPLLLVGRVDHHEGIAVWRPARVCQNTLRSVALPVIEEEILARPELRGRAAQRE